jgi:GT2 family glycosyltransferase
MIYFFTPYSWSHDIGKAYNDYCKLVSSKDDWICLMDGDLMFLQSDFGHQIQEIIDLHGSNFGLFTCLVNRVGTLKQCHQDTISEDPNIITHRKIAIQLAQERRHVIKEIPNPISGHLMLFKKETWESIGGFPEERGILAVDNTFSNRMARHGYKIAVMEGVYCLHYYRLLEGRKNKSHLL